MKQKIKGAMNLTNPGLITHNEILAMYKELVDSNFSSILTSKREEEFLSTKERSKKLYSFNQGGRSINYGGSHCC